MISKSVIKRNETDKPYNDDSVKGKLHDELELLIIQLTLQSRKIKNIFRALCLDFV